MDRNRDRSMNLEKMLNYLGLVYTRFRAIDGQAYYSDNTYLSYYKHSNQVKLDRNLTIQHRRPTRKLSNGQVGCFLSHLLVLLEIASSETNSPTLVLEDDVDLERDFLNMLVNSMRRLPDDWDIFLCGYCCHVERNRVNRDLIEMEFYLAFHCQVVRNSSVARRLAAKINLDRLDLPIDNMIGGLTREKHFKVYGLREMIAIQRRDLYKSEIASSKRFKKETLKNSLLQFLNSPILPG